MKRFVITALSGAMLLGACGGGSDVAAPRTPAATATSPAAGGNAGTDATLPNPSGVNACDVFTVEDAATATGVDADALRTQDQGMTCSYTDEAGATASVSVYPGESWDEVIAQTEKMTDSKFERVPALGDDAYWGAIGLLVRDEGSGKYIQVILYAGTQQDKDASIELARAVLGRL